MLPAKDTAWPFLPGQGPRIVRGDGAWLIADDGRRILDAAGGAIVANVGHGRAEVTSAAAAANSAFVVPTWPTPEREALVERLRHRWLPPGLGHIHLTCGGSEGVEAAVKIALQHFAARGEARRTRIMARELSYHGTTIAMAGLSGHASRKRGLEAFLPTFLAAPTPSPLRRPADVAPAEAGAWYVAATRAAMEAADPATIAAFVVEPITGSSGGAIVPPEGYLSGIRALCDEFGILLIVDEVMTGFGRLGKRFGCEAFDLRPDLLVAGKGLAGGYAAITGVYATEAVAAPLAAAGFDVMFHTFAALPSACAAAGAVLDILEREALVERSDRLGQRLGAALQSALGQHPHVAEVRGKGLLWAVEIVRDRESLVPFNIEARITNRVVAAGLKRGVFYYPGGTGAARDIVCLGPPFVAAESEIDQMADVLAACVAEATG